MDVKAGAYKLAGIHGRLKAAGSVITGILLIIIGAYFSIMFKSLQPLILSLIGLASIIYGWILWRRCSSLLEGRFT